MLKDMRSRLDQRYKIEWKQYFLVRIQPERVYMGSGTAMSFSYETVERGVALDGSVLMRRFNRHSSLHSSMWIVEPWPKEIRENGMLVATIVGTPENERRLELFREKIDQLRKALAAMVTPERLEQTLVAAAEDDFLAIGQGA